eukprot:TRINITY_DN55749_c0_g1_i1.p1 TRINITY_DN55749_c0_g1~~TRINITY_DN55749_c0_g1_i1.p1  ORF type:complete len:359 (+),score=90.80 TRINITY_DN55749_c0_g1_i1:78-1154(+)
MEERERCLMEQPVAVLQAHAQECGINVSDTLEKRELVQQILRAEPLFSRGGHESPRDTPRMAQSEEDLLADEQLARRLQAEEEGAHARLAALAAASVSRGGGPAGVGTTAASSLLELLGGASAAQGGERRGGEGAIPVPGGLAQALEGLFRARAAAAAAARDASRAGDVSGDASGDAGSGATGEAAADGARTNEPLLQLLGSMRAVTAAERAARAAGEAGEEAEGDQEGGSTRPSSEAADADAAAQVLVGLLGQALSQGDGQGARSVLSALLGGALPQQGIDANTVARRTLITTLGEQDQNSGGLSEEHRTCMVCLEEFRGGDEVRILPCLHRYHRECVDNWLAVNRHCPVCKHDVTR